MVLRNIVYPATAHCRGALRRLARLGMNKMIARNFAFVAAFLGSACGTLLVAKPLLSSHIEERSRHSLGNHGLKAVLSAQALMKKENSQDP